MTILDSTNLAPIDLLSPAALVHMLLLKTQYVGCHYAPKQHNLPFAAKAVSQTSREGLLRKNLWITISPFTISPSAFMRSRNEDTWTKVSEGSQYNILLSHAPPRGYLDQNRRGERTSCEKFWLHSNGSNQSLQSSVIFMKFEGRAPSPEMMTQPQLSTMWR